MRKRKTHSPLPSINALRSFESTARLGSVTKAADELCVTPSAVSHQIRKLEGTFDCRLIDFIGGTAVLTECGATLLPGLSDGFMRIRDAVHLLRDQRGTQTLTIAARPLFASKMLSPRLDRFWELHPDIGLRMRYLTQEFEDPDDRADVSIDWYAAPPADPACVPLFPADLSPVCSSSLNIDTDMANLPHSLNGTTLLRETQQDYWRDWLMQIDASEFQPERTTFVDDGSIRLSAAIAGKGIDLSVPSFLEQEFADGRLMEPFPDLRLSGHYYLLFPKHPREEARAFQNWLLDEISGAQHDSRPANL